MGQRDQPVGLAAAVGGVEPENRRDFTARSGQPAAHIGEQVLEASCGIGVREESSRIEVFLVSLTDNDLGQIRREVGLGNRSPENICTWPAGLEYRWDGHGFCSTCAPVLSGPTAFASVHWSISLFLNRQEPPTTRGLST